MLKLQLEFWQSGEEKFAYLSVARMEKVSWVSLVSDRSRTGVGAQMNSMYSYTHVTGVATNLAQCL